MAQPQKHPLRPLTKQEQQEMQRIVKSTSERVDVVRRARALLAVAELQTWTQAARAAGFKRRARVSLLVERFNHRGLAALLTMLNACAGGVSVVNIDNGFGAACVASRINRLAASSTAKTAP